MPVLLPEALAGAARDRSPLRSKPRGSAAASYFSPHLGEQPWFRDIALIEPTPVADAVGSRMLSLPITDAMTPADAATIAEALAAICTDHAAQPRAPARRAHAARSPTCSWSAAALPAPRC